MANEAVLSGQLDGFRPAELLQMMGLNASTGALHLREERGRTGIVYFENGAIVSCAELDSEALTLGHVLRQLNFATSEQLEHAYRLQTQDLLGKRIGERLIDLGYLTAEKLETALRTQALWTLRDMALWRHGTYAFHPDERPPATGDMLHIDSSKAVIQIIRHESEWDDLIELLPDGMRTRVAMANMPPAGHPLTFDPSAWQVIARVNANHTVRRIATALRKPEAEVARMVGGMVREGLLVTVSISAIPGLRDQGMNLGSFDLFSLLLLFEQDWLKRKSPADHLAGLATYINKTMAALQEACQQSEFTLADDTLAILLARDRLTTIDGYELRVARNRIDVDDFAAYCRGVFEGAARGQMGASKAFYEHATEILLLGLAAEFKAINARIPEPKTRLENQDAWEALFHTFREQAQASA